MLSYTLAICVSPRLRRRTRNTTRNVFVTIRILCLRHDDHWLLTYDSSLAQSIPARLVDEATGERSRASAGIATAAAQTSASPTLANVEIAPDDPLLAYFQQNASVTELDRIHVDSPALAALRAAGVKLVIPLVSQGELIGLINLGPRLSDQEYTGDDRRMLNNLAVQAAPAGARGTTRAPAAAGGART